MLIESTGLIGTVDEVTGGKFTTACGYLPSGTGGRWVPSGGNGLSIMTGVSDPVRDAAWEFIAYLHDTDNYAEYVELTGYIPITPGTEAALADVIAADPRRQVAIDQLAFSRWHYENSHHRPRRTRDVERLDRGSADRYRRNPAPYAVTE